MRPKLTLDAHVERAGCTMACAYSTSDEFEAAVIKAKLAAGAYGPRRHRRRALWLGAAAAAVLAAVIVMF
jgi:hypothetical protein